MKQFTIIEKLDTGILYLCRACLKPVVLLLAFGLIASMANVLTKGSVLTDNLFMQRVWAWTQCIAIDASVVGTIYTHLPLPLRGRAGKNPAVWPALSLFVILCKRRAEGVSRTI